jgi:thiamine pyrophosphate-dependent acetolactate synthase large subunit-like protein
MAIDTTPTRVDQLTVPAARPSKPEWGSDVVADMVRMLGIEYIALNPGASYRGFHDSLVNYNGNERPSMILCNHEEVAVAVAHGYAKVAGRAMAASLHSNVGLMHGSMGIFNAFVDRAPVMVFGGTGPMDSTRRRPWIDWIHTANNQGGMVRDFTKWEHQPASIAAIPEAILRGWHLAMAEPCGPVYICLDAGLQEERIEGEIQLPDVARYPLPAPLEPSPEAIRTAAAWLAEAQFPVILLGRSAQNQRAWDQLVELAELLGAAVLGDSKSPTSFPTDHYLQQASFGIRGGGDFIATLRQADCVLALERIDPMGQLRAAFSTSKDPRLGLQVDLAALPKLITVSVDSFAVRSWTTDFYELPPANLPIVANVERTVAELLEQTRRVMRDDGGARSRAEQRAERHRGRRAELQAGWDAFTRERWDQQPITVERMVGELKNAMGAQYAEAIVARIPLTWPSGVWEFSRPLAHLGGDGGGGVGSGPGMSVGAALAARSTGRPVVSFVGDGDLLMSPSALWTAAHHGIPILFVVANNRSYYNDEEHQDRVARVRNRPPENRWIGQRIDEPPVNFAGLARDLGAAGFGPVADPDDLAEAYRGALNAVSEGGPALVDVHISPR